MTVFYPIRAPSVEQLYILLHQIIKRVMKLSVNVGVMSFSQQHCDHCLHRCSKRGKLSYFHNVLEAKLITPNGFSISIATEWIENPEGEYDKQDCELKAFKRLAVKLKTSFPRLPLCITADGLYPNQGFFEQCKRNDWRYIVTFKDANLPTVWQEVQALCAITPQCATHRATHPRPLRDR